MSKGRKEVSLIKSRDPYLTGGEKMGFMTFIRFGLGFLRFSMGMYGTCLDPKRIGPKGFKP